MVRTDTIALAAALVCFGIFFVNVAIGAAGRSVFLGDVTEMLMLLAASILFVVGILQREAATKENPNNV